VVVEMKPRHACVWFPLGAYRSQDEAEIQAALARKRAPEASFRVAKFQEGQP
jgi:hypothetical protein